MFGDNMMVVDTASAPHGKLHKRHTALFYHRTRFAITAGAVRYHHIAGDRNPVDILSKHWDFPSVWPQLYPLLFWPGDTADLVVPDQKTSKDVPVLDGGSTDPKDAATTPTE